MSLAEVLNFYRRNPLKFVEEVIGVVPTTQQAQVLNVVPYAIENKKGIVVKSGHGTGKTALESWIVLWWMTCFVYPKIPCTAPTQHQLYDVLWTELAKWHKKSKVADMFEWRKTHFWNKDYPEAWFAVAQTSSKPDALQGFHAKHLLFMIEEASGVPTEIIEVAEGTQTQEGALIIMFGNPTQVSGAFYDAFHDKRSFYYTFTFNSEGSPLVDESYYKRIAAKYGRDSDIYRVRVLGEFPKAEPDTLISVDVCEKAAMKEDVFPNRQFWQDIEIGVDVARFGDDETVIYSRVGKVINFENAFRNRDLMYVTGEVVKVIKMYEGKNVMVNVDDSGLGGGVTDRLKELAMQGIINCAVFGVNNGGSARSDKFLNVGAEMWFFMKDWLTDGKIPNDSDLIAQLSTRKYSVNSSGKNVIESKEHMKSRGLTSPDRADAAILTLRSLLYSGVDRKALFAMA